jgi:hypothetical protein
MHQYRSTSTRKDSPFFRHFLKAMVHLSVIRILRLRSASEILNRRFGGLQVSPRLRFAHVADAVTDSEAPLAAARHGASDVDDALAAPLVTAEAPGPSRFGGNLG